MRTVATVEDLAESDVWQGQKLERRDVQVPPHVATQPALARRNSEVVRTNPTTTGTGPTADGRYRAAQTANSPGPPHTRPHTRPHHIKLKTHIPHAKHRCRTHVCWLNQVIAVLITICAQVQWRALGAPAGRVHTCMHCKRGIVDRWTPEWRARTPCVAM